MEGLGIAAMAVLLTPATKSTVQGGRASELCTIRSALMSCSSVHPEAQQSTPVSDRLPHPGEH